jgi:hypothetical protein
VEQLDHRQLLSVNFTGNVATDFTGTVNNGVVIFNGSNTPNIQHPIIPSNLQPYIHVSGFDLAEIRVSYDAALDTLYVGFNQPPSGNPGQPGPVIAGDADDNGNAGTVNPAVELAAPGFTEFTALGGPEEMAAFLTFNGTGVPQVVAGFSPNPPPATPSDPMPPKPYQVALAIPNPSNPKGIPAFGTSLPFNTGDVFLFNSPAHPNLEFSIAHFSELYQAETGKPLTPSSTIQIGGFAGSPDTIGVSDAFFPPSTFTIQHATQPPHCPPMSPPIFINPHEHNHINTAHPDLIRVSVLGTSGFNATDINPSTVTLGGAHPVFAFTRPFRGYQQLGETFIFKGTDVKLPAGITQATVSGSLFDGTMFSTTETVFNRNSSFFSPADVQAQQERWAARGGDRPGLNAYLSALEPEVASHGGKVTLSPSAPIQLSGVAAPAATAVHVDYSRSGTNATGPVVRIPRREPAAAVRGTAHPGPAVRINTPRVTNTTGPVISIPKREPVVAGQSHARISPKLQASMNSFAQNAGVSSSGSMSAS